MKLAFFRGSTGSPIHPLIRWWTHGPYSHVELIIIEKDGRYLVGSSLPGKGVFIEWKTFDEKDWDIIDCPIGSPLHAQLVFERFAGAKYDYLGIFGFILRRGQHYEHRWFCSEIIAGAIGFRNPWRFCPNALYDVVKSLKKH